MVTSDSVTDQEETELRVVWKSVLMVSGAQCVMTSGMLLMLKWSADS